MKYEKSIRWLSIVWIVLIVIGISLLIAYFCYESNNSLNNGPIKLLKNLDHFEQTLNRARGFNSEWITWFNDPTLKIAGLLAIFSLIWLGLTAIVWASIAIVNAFSYDKYTTKYKWIITFIIPIIGTYLPNKRELR